VKVILISDFDKCSDPQIINQIFELGLDRFHIREYDKDDSLIMEFVNHIDTNFRNKLSFHGDGSKFGIASHGKVSSSISESCHSVDEVAKTNKDYVFLSPIFDSISKPGYKSDFDLQSIFRQIQNVNTEVYALGGIDNANVKLLKGSSFQGVGLKGAIWNKGDNPIYKFKEFINCLND